MCGGIAVALRPVAGGSRWLALYYHSGRIMGYALIGGLLGSAAAAVEFASWTIILRYIAAALLVAMGLNVLGVASGITALERLGGGLWRRLQPFTRPLLPPRHPLQGVALGIFWGFMPCGLIYSALTWSVATGGSGVNSALLMALFGLGTLPAMLTATLAGQKVETILRHRRVKQFIGLSLCVAGLWTAYHTFSHSDHLLGRHQGAHTTHSSMHSEPTHSPAPDIETLEHQHEPRTLPDSEAPEHSTGEAQHNHQAHY
jgi:hypothetical protein